MNKKKVIIGIVFVLLFAAFFGFDLQTYFNLEYFQSQKQSILDYKADNFGLLGAMYFLIYVVVAALSLPAAGIVTLVGGAVFGFWWGLLLVSFASSIGATLAFLLSRTVLRDWVQEKFGASLQAVNEGIEKDGAFYLFSLRLIPVIPFFLVNLMMGLTSIKAKTFYFASQLGMLFGTAIYVNLGATLGSSTSLPDVLSLKMVLAIAAMVIFPWVAKGIVRVYQEHKILKPFAKPKQFDANMVVIGAGSGGLVSSLIASIVKAKVILIEKHKMGGDCLNTGCVPSKALIRSASVNHLLSRANEFGLDDASAQVNFPKVMQRIKEVISTIEPHDSVERYTNMGVECIEGEATITSPYTVEVNGREISTRNIIIASGARPFVPPIEGIEQSDYLTSDTIWNLDQLPKRLLVMGGGPIGCELAQAFARLGAKVTQIDQAKRILPREDEDVSSLVAQNLQKEGITLLNGYKIVRFETRDNTKVAIAQKANDNDEELIIEYDQVLLAVGRKANTEGFGLESLNIELTKTGTLSVNEYLQTNYPNIYACGDVAGPYQFTHMASHQAWYATVNSLFRGLRKYKVNYSVVPWATFTDPEIARVGLNETDAKAKNIDYEVTRYGIDDLDRAIADGENFGFVKVLTVPGKDKILGVTIVGYHSAELLSEFTLAMTHGLGLKKIMATIHVYPTLSESNKFAAGQWQKSHAPEWVFPYLEKFHQWRRK